MADLNSAHPLDRQASGVAEDGRGAFDAGLVDVRESLQSIRTLTGMTGNGHKYRSVLRDFGMWRMLAARSGTLKPGLVQRAKAWGGEDA